MKHSETPDTVLHAQKPIWKSVGFWLGMVIAVFLVWLMVQSSSFATSFGRVTPIETWAIGLNDASFQIRSVDTATVGHSISSGWGFRKTRITGQDLEQGILPLAGKWRFMEIEDHWGWEFTTYVSIPLWFILTLWLALWLTTLRWWRRKCRKRMEFVRVTGE